VAALPIDLPQKIICVGMNYRDHAAEAGLPVPERPILFAKWPNALIGPGETIVIPPWVEEVDYEAELAVVIGRRARGLSVDEALGAVGGYTCLNDVSSRKIQFEDGQWSRAKTFDTFCPVGPTVVPVDAVPDPQALAVRCSVNGRLLQDSTTAEMVFGVAEIVSFVSTAITLEPGDLIATGTPFGVGYTREPPVFLEDGDEVTVEIDRIGALTNPVRKES
jgi:2-keto-4-pentenoate hydratase/2-oxohepta-3-ene-1,7-dioic acid hydratase in catechol pathway